MKAKGILLVALLFCIPLAAQQTEQEEVSFQSTYIIPKYVFAGGIGYSYILNNPADGVDEDVYNRLRSGVDWNLAFYRYYKNGVGWGFMYDGYYSKVNVDIGNGTARLIYLAPQFTCMRPLNEHWSLHAEIGLGLLRYKETAQTYNIRDAVEDNTIGGNYGMGIGYNINRNLTLTLNASMIGGTFDSDDWVNEITTDDEWGVNRINIGIGVRLFLW